MSDFAGKSREGSVLAPDSHAPDHAPRRTPRNLCATPALVTFGGGLVVSVLKVDRTEMALSDDDTKKNVVRLGTETLFAIADQLRRMYDADLRAKPSERLEKLMQRIERDDEDPR